MGSLILSLETILNDSYENFQTMTGINVSGDMLNNSNLLAFLYKCDTVNLHFKVTPTSFWLKCINLPKCTKFCSARKLEVADKKFRFLTKKYLMNWQIRGLKDTCHAIFGLYTQIFELKFSLWQ